MDIELLRSVSILRELTDEELAAFAGIVRMQDAKPKERLVEEGKPLDSFAIVCEGIVHIRRLATTREMLLGRLGPGGFFGEINLFDPGVATASIYATKPVRLALVTHESFRDFMGAHPAIGYKIVSAMMKEMARRLRTTSARLVNATYWATAAGALPPEEGGGGGAIPDSGS